MFSYGYGYWFGYQKLLYRYGYRFGYIHGWILVSGHPYWGDKGSWTMDGLFFHKKHDFFKFLDIMISIINFVFCVELHIKKYEFFVYLMSLQTFFAQ